MPDTDLLSLQIEHVGILQSRYEQVLEHHGYDGLLISSGAAHVRYGDDQSWHFQGYGPFLHWTGLAGFEHAWLVIRRGQKPLLSLYQPVDFWHARLELGQEPWLKEFELRFSESPSAPALDGMNQLAVIGDPSLLTGVPGEHNPDALCAAFDETRVLKTAYEIACLAHANKLAMAGHRAARDAFLAGASEFDINLAYQRATQQREVDAPYPSIIGVNEHAGILHYQYYDTAAPKKSRSLLIDAGVRYRGYCSDITRTTAGVGEGRFAALAQGLEQLQFRLCKMVAPGVDYVDIGHFLGVQVHDVAGKPVPSPADAPFLRLMRTLEPGMVVTIEPGLYFIPSLLEPLLSGPLGRHINRPLLDELQGCGGIRIEDNVVVTDTGGRNLTREAEG